MRKIVVLSAAVAGFALLAISAPADAATHKTADAAGVAQTVQMDLSARRYYRHYYYHRHYRYYGRYHYYRRYYGGPYYYRPYYYSPYPYYYRPRYYPYGYYPYYYRRSGIYFGFGW